MQIHFSISEFLVCANCVVLGLVEWVIGNIGKSPSVNIIEYFKVSNEMKT